MAGLKPKSIWHFVERDLKSPLRHSPSNTNIKIYGMFAAEFEIGQTFITLHVGLFDSSAIGGFEWRHMFEMNWDQLQELVIQ